MKLIIAKAQEDMVVVAIEWPSMSLLTRRRNREKPLLGDTARYSRTRVRMYCQRVTETLRKR